MRVCMVTPHLPPEQAANALLPRQLGDALVPLGVTTRYVTHPPAVPADGATRPTTPADVVYVPRRGKGILARSPLGAIAAAVRMARGAYGPIGASDLVHLHGNGFIIEVARLVAARLRKPYVLTLYGTDVWHHDPVRHARFGRVVRGAACRVFYSEGLLEFAKGLSLAPEPSLVIYAPVPSTFEPVSAERRASLRRDLGIGDGPLLLTVKRLHEVAGYDVLLRAMPSVLRDRPDARLWIAGEGELRPRLETQARELGLGEHVRFLGLVDNGSLWRYYAAADLFVLPSRLESWGTVMLEALACGTPVVATDTTGGLEVQRHFPDDVMVAAREDADALARAVAGALSAGRRTGDATRRRLADEFSVAACAGRYLRVYEQSLGGIRP